MRGCSPILSFSSNHVGDCTISFMEEQPDSHASWLSDCIPIHIRLLLLAYTVFVNHIFLHWLNRSSCEQSRFHFATRQISEFLHACQSDIKLPSPQDLAFSGVSGFFWPNWSFPPRLRLEARVPGRIPLLPFSLCRDKPASLLPFYLWPSWSSICDPDFHNSHT